MVHQHFMLVPEFLVVENFALGTLEETSGVLDIGSVRLNLESIAKELGWEIDPFARTGALPVGAQQRLEIMKALAGDARVLILDEPTAVLSANEVEDLFRVMRRLRDEARCVILIAHKLSEVLSVADRVTVLRRGSVVATAETADTSAAQLAEWMVGEVPEVAGGGGELGSVILDVRDLQVRGDRGEGAVRGVSFSVRAGEVLGIGGVDGNGQDELAEALVGLRAWVSGSVACHAAQIGYVPPDRQREGLALDMSVYENVLIGDNTLWNGPFLRAGLLRIKTEKVVAEFDVRVGGLGDPVRALSGGNQQKLLIGRVLSEGPGNNPSPPEGKGGFLLVVSNPTRGLDVRASAFVRSRILEAARSGAAVVLFSTDLDEIAELATRTVFMNRGQLREGGAEAIVG
jgi:simple sugar transport system ATP-binding protein